MLFNVINASFNNNLLNLNFSKTLYLEFSSIKLNNIKLQIEHNRNYVSNKSETTFLGLTVDDTLAWKQHIDQLKKMSTACYALKYSLPIETLKKIYFAHIRNIVSYGVIFWVTHDKKLFIFQKEIIRIITITRPRDSCREIFMNMQIMTLYYQYIYTLLLFTVDNKHLFTADNEIHKYSTTNYNNLHPALANLTKYNKGPYISGIKVFSHISQYLKALVHNPKHFRFSLKRFLFHHTFYSIEEYYEYKEYTI